MTASVAPGRLPSAQKVLLARRLAVGPKILLLDEATRGISIGVGVKVKVKASAKDSAEVQVLRALSLPAASRAVSRAEAAS